MKVVKTLWTGGLDSTFMVLRYLRMGYTVQPVYCRWGENHHDYEIETIKGITDVIREKNLSGSLLDVKIINFPLESNNLSWFSDEIANAWKKIYLGYLKTPPFVLSRQRSFQYLRFASLGSEYDGAGIAIPFDSNGKSGLRNLFSTIGNLKFDENSIGYFTKEDCDDAIYSIFGRFKFPVANFDERAIIENVKNWGLEDILRLVRFCRNQENFNHGPCGMCMPCQIKFGHEMYEFFDLGAWKRAKVFTKLSERYGKKDIKYIFGHFKTFCAARDIMPNCRLEKISEICGVPLGFCFIFEEELNNTNPPKEIEDVLGKYC